MIRPYRLLSAAGAAAALLLAPPALGAAELPAALTLDQALALAARQSHDLTMARSDVVLADADALTAVSGALPRLDLTSSAGRQYLGDTTIISAFPVFDQGQFKGFAQQAVPVPATSYESYSLGLRLQLPLIAPATWKLVSQARAQSRAAARTYDESRLAVAFDVTRLFYELVKADRSLAVLEKAAQRSEELAARSDALFLAGHAQKADTYAARVNLGNDRIAVEQARTRLAQARSDLAVALGQPGDAPLQAVAPAVLEQPGLPSAELLALPDLLSVARERRPALKAALAQVEAADAAISAADYGWSPTISGLATYDRVGIQASGRDGVFGDPTRQYNATAQVVLSWNLFAGRSTEASQVRARAAAEKARASAAKVGDSVAREVTVARQSVLALVRQVALSADNLVASEQGLTLARQRLEAGLASQLEVRDATLKLTQAELTLVQARIDHAVAAADLNRAVGGAL